MKKLGELSNEVQNEELLNKTEDIIFKKDISKKLSFQYKSIDKKF